jgi:hypothetical protein
VVRTIASMSEQPVGTPGAGKVPPAPTVEKRVRRTTLSTGFSDVPGKTCPTCGFQGFRWQMERPQGHPLA